MPLVAYYPLDEASGDAQDYSGNALNGTLSGGVTQDVPGILGTSAYDFDGTDGYVNIPNFPNFNAYTVSIWINADNVTDRGDFIALRTNNGILLLVNNGGITFFHDTGSAEEVVGGGTISTNTWYHAVLSWDGSTATAYLNGSKVGETSTSSNTADSKGDNFGGAGFDNQNYFDGTISNVRVYDHALTAGEVQYLYEVSQSANFTTDKRLL